MKTLSIAEAADYQREWRKKNPEKYANIRGVIG